MKKFLSTLIMKKYLFSLIFRVLIFLTFLYVYLTDRNSLLDLVMQPLAMGITPVHILWVIFMVIMLMHIFPGNKITMALKKMEEKEQRVNLIFYINDFCTVVLSSSIF